MRFGFGEFWNCDDLMPRLQALPSRPHCILPDRFNALGECLQQYNGSTSRIITVTYGLIGLYLALENEFTCKHADRTDPDGLARDHVLRSAGGIPVREVLLAITDAGKDARFRQRMDAVWVSWEDRPAWEMETTEVLLGRAYK